MNLRDLAEDYLRSAEVRIKSAELASSTGNYPDSVRFSQEAVELSLKASLRMIGVEYPKEHDVGKILKSVADRFPAWFRTETDSLSRISSVLAAKRAASMYGLEAAGKKPSEIFGEVDAGTALSDARYVVALAQRLFKEP